MTSAQDCWTDWLLAFECAGPFLPLAEMTGLLDRCPDRQSDQARYLAAAIALETSHRHLERSERLMARLAITGTGAVWPAGSP